MPRCYANKFVTPVRVVFKMEDELLTKAKIAALMHRITLQDFVIEALTEKLEKYEKEENN